MGQIIKVNINNIVSYGQLWWKYILDFLVELRTDIDGLNLDIDLTPNM